MWLDTKAVDIDDPAIEGKRIYGAPRFTVTGRVEYNPSYLRPLTLAFGGKYVSNMAVDAANTQFVPAYVTYDLSGRYETRIAGKDVTFRAGINNLFNRRYWTTAWGYYVSAVGDAHGGRERYVAVLMPGLADSMLQRTRSAIST